MTILTGLIRFIIPAKCKGAIVVVIVWKLDL